MLYIKTESGHYRTAREDDVIAEATSIYDQYFLRGTLMGSDDKASDYIKLKLASLEHEVFVCLYLDNRHRLISFDEMARGTIDGASVYPREIVKTALQHNAAALIFAHNHPSGLTEPSTADKAITTKMIKALELIDVRVLDHFIIGEGKPYSFAGNGLI